MDKAFIEVRVEDSIDSMVQKSVSYRSLVNVSRLRVGDVESMIGTVGVGFILQVLVQRENVVHEVKLKLLDIFLLPLPS